MRTFEEAFEEAKKHLDRITVCHEYATAYEFGDETEDMLGGLQYVGVWKDPAKPVMDEFSFINELSAEGYSYEEPIRTIKLDWER